MYWVYLFSFAGFVAVACIATALFLERDINIATQRRSKL